MFSWSLNDFYNSPYAKRPEGVALSLSKGCRQALKLLEINLTTSDKVY